MGNQPGGVKDKIRAELDEALSLAEGLYVPGNEEVPSFFTSALSEELVTSIEDMSRKSAIATTGFTNLITGTASKAAYGADIDSRYHQVGIQKEAGIKARFSFRSVSESIVYPWLYKNKFNYAKSGWQTRTFERPKPYLLSYDENIGDGIKASFLNCYHQLEEHGQDAKAALALLIWWQLVLRGTRHPLVKPPQTNSVSRVMMYFESHFDFDFMHQKGSSRLPVLAIQSIYKVLVSELKRYEGKELRELEPHSAADVHTGSAGDITVVNQDGSVFEGVEVKHRIPINMNMLESAREKIERSSAERYYILTTHDQKLKKEIEDEIIIINNESGCQLIVNGVISSMNYYLRLLSDPSDVLPIYSLYLSEDHAITPEMIDAWNKLLSMPVERGVYPVRS